MDRGLAVAGAGHPIARIVVEKWTAAGELVPHV
jgi:hypothetical protein